MSTVTFYVIPELIYPTRAMELMKGLSSAHKKVLYVSLFKRFAEIESGLGNSANIMIVSPEGPSTNKQFFPLEEACSLARLSEVMDALLKRKDFNVVFFDSFSDLNVLNGLYVCKKFFFYLKSRLALQKIDFVAALKDNESSSRLVPLIREQVDHLIFEK